MNPQYMQQQQQQQIQPPNIPPPIGKNSPVMPTSLNVNGFNNPTETLSPGSLGHTDPGGKRVIPNQEPQSDVTNQQGLSTSQSASLPYSRPSITHTTNMTTQHFINQTSTNEHGFHTDAILSGQLDVSPRKLNFSNMQQSTQKNQLVQSQGQKNVSHLQERQNSPLSGSPLHNVLRQQNLSSSPLQGHQSLSTSLSQGQQNLSAPPLQGQQNLSAPPLQGQQNFSVPPSQGQQNLSALSLQRQHNLPFSPLQGPQNLPTSPLQGQQNSSNSPLPGQHLQGQQNLSALPLQGKQNLSGPPLQGQQNFSAPPSQGQLNFSAPPSQGQLNFSAPPSQGQQNFSAPPLQGQQNLSGPPLQGSQNSSNLPLQGQHLSSPYLQGQQNISTSSLQGQQNLSGPPLQGQQNLSSPPLPGQQNFSGLPLAGQQNFSAPPLQGQHNLSGPPLPGQQNFSVPSLQGQHSLSGPPLKGQTNLSGPPIAGQKYPGQFNNQPQISNPPNFGQLQPDQRQYTSGPPIPGQPLPSPMGFNRTMSGTMPGYQQGGYQQPNYQNQADPYGTHRSPYPGSMPGASEGYQSGAQQQQPRHLDPEHMPSPIQVMQDDQHVRGGTFVTNQRGLVPPLVTTKFITQDQGNASPRFIRSTMYTVPTTADIIKQTSVPFGLIISPMARIVEGEYEPPVVDMGEIGPVRCVRCKAYMCPYMQFIDAGRRFQCMFCKATTEVPAEYFQHLDHTGQRMDRYERPELMLGTFEYIATKDYCGKNTFPKPPAIVFVIDVSYNTVKSGLINLLCMKMKSIIQHLPVDAGQTKSNMKVGFITYNNTVHFYNINPCLAQPQMMIVGDIQDVFMPLLDGFLCDVEESEAIINSLMVQIPAIFADTRETETILAPAIQAGLEALKASECSGKLMVFHSSLPIAEAPGKLKNRDDRILLGTDKEKSVLAPQNNVYNNLGQECVGAGCSVDLFVFNNSYVDIATIGQVSRLTGGEVYKYTYFQADIDGERLVSDIITNISRPIAFDAIMRVRTSTGVRATDFYGHFFMSNTTDMELASIDCNKAIAVEIKHDDKLTDNDGVYIQAALLYTSCGGIRRLRIINFSLKTSSQMAELYRSCDLDAIINYFSKQSVFKITESTPKAVKDNLISRCANILAAYRKHCSSPSSAAQLILPECMKLLPLYINCLLKSDAISGGADMTIDDRSYVMQAVTTMPVSISVAYIYPRLIPLHDIDPQGTHYPGMLRCSIDKFEEDGVYLLENSIHMFLWIGLAVSPQWVQAVFGVPSVVQIDIDRATLPLLDTTLNKRISDIINQVRVERHRCMRLTIVRQREKLEMVLRHFLIEDRGNDGSPSYVDFLCHMHKEIRTLLSQ